MALPRLRALTRRGGRVPWQEVEYWALDLEMGGLDPNEDPLLAVGMVPIRRGLVRLDEAYASLVHSSKDRSPDPGAIAAHHILPEQSRKAPSLAGVLEEVERRLRGHVLLVHHARLDVAFLKRAYRRSGLRWSRPVVIDTVTLLWRWASRRRLLGGSDAAPSLNLSEARAELGLPAYPPHAALTDAIATAELFLTLRARLGVVRLAELL